MGAEHGPANNHAPLSPVLAHWWAEKLHTCLGDGTSLQETWMLQKAGSEPVPAASILVDLAMPRGQTMLCVCFKPLHVWSSVIVKGWFPLPQKSLEAALAVGFLGDRLHQERQQQGPFR